MARLNGAAKHTASVGKPGVLPHVVINGRVHYVWEGNPRGRRSRSEIEAETFGRDVADYVVWRR